MVSRTVWPGPLREISSCVMTAFALLEFGAWMPPTSFARLPVTTIAFFSNSTVPVD